MTGNHLAHVFSARVAQYGHRTALRYRDGGEWRDVSWRGLGEQAQAVARALVESGVGEGDRVGIWSPNRPEWTVADIGCLRACAVSVPIYSTSTVRQAAYIVDEAEVKVLFVGGPEQYDKAKSLLGVSPSLRRLVVFDPNVVVDVPDAVSFADFVRLNPQVADFYRRRLDERSADLAPFERIVRFTLLPEPLTVEGGEITPTMKVRRKAAAERHRAAIDAMYSDG